MHIEHVYTERYMDPCIAHSYAHRACLHTMGMQRSYTDHTCMDSYTAHISAYSSTYRNILIHAQHIPMHTWTMLACRTLLHAEHTHRDTLNQSTYQTESQLLWPLPRRLVDCFYFLVTACRPLALSPVRHNRAAGLLWEGCVGEQTGTHTEQAG